MHENTDEYATGNQNSEFILSENFILSIDTGSYMVYNWCE